MREEGFFPTLPAQAASELHAIEAAPERPLHAPGILDLRHLLWSSIDNRESRDLDQVEVAERLANGNILLRAGLQVYIVVAHTTAADRAKARGALQ